MRDSLFRIPPPERRWSPWSGLVSLLVHVAVVVAAVVAAGHGVEQITTYIILQDPGAPGAREVRLPPVTPTAGEGGRAGRVPDAVPREIPVEPPDTIVLALDPLADIPVLGEAGVEPGPDTATAIPGEESPNPRRRLGPAYAGGRLWVRPFEAELGVVGPSPSLAIHIARVDSALRERIKAFIDTMPRDSFALPPPARWTAEIEGKKWGVDQQWIYLGDFKLPTALLALLPLPQGNYDRARDAQELQRIRTEIIDAARRAENSAEFNQYVKDLRRRKDEERAAERARAAVARRDTIPDRYP
ncbi:MAG TPA: hypothetical protein VGA22_00790 [Gemmatimonadales bacterium]|jgi:hypothetical protein